MPTPKTGFSRRGPFNGHTYRSKTWVDTFVTAELVRNCVNSRQFRSSFIVKEINKGGGSQYPLVLIINYYQIMKKFCNAFSCNILYMYSVFRFVLAQFGLIGF